MSERPILLVEDCADDELLALHVVRQAAIRDPVVVARDGLEALALLFPGDGAPPPELPKLILLDLRLPKLSGLDLLRRVRAHAATQSIPVIVLTGSIEDEDLLRSYANGANGYLRKPIDRASFTRSLEMLALAP